MMKKMILMRLLIVLNDQSPSRNFRWAVSKAHADALRSMGEFLYRNDDNDRALSYLEEAVSKLYDKILQPMIHGVQMR